jgi:hypothetical protein
VEQEDELLRVEAGRRDEEEEGDRRSSGGLQENWQHSSTEDLQVFLHHSI